MSDKNPCRIITPKEAKEVLRRSSRTISRILDDVRAENGKVYPQPVTVKEFCDNLNLDIDDVYRILKWD